MTQHTLNLVGGALAPQPPTISWRRHGVKGMTCGAQFEMLFGDKPTGWWVIHCAHPTALRPYYIVDKKGRSSARKYSLVKTARDAAEMQYRESQP